LATGQNGGKAARLLAWYDVHRRELPWRMGPGETADPYRVWLSEIMLQQTTVQAVARYYRKFTARWPTVADLAAANLDDVLASWAGLGYYARARNLHKAAQRVAMEHGGRFPPTIEELQKLPGIGAYTAGAIAAIAFGAREAAMDANAERVVARVFGVDEPLPGAKAKLLARCRSVLPRTRSGDFVQALMDLGSAICTVKRPACAECPWMDDCVARRKGNTEALPVKTPKPQRPLKRGAAFVARDKTGAVLLVKRPEKGLLGAMLQPPLGPWTSKFPSREEALSQAPFRAVWKKLPGIVRHGFTHFELEIEVWVADVKTPPRHIQDCHFRPSDAKRREGKGIQDATTSDVRAPGSPSLGVLTHASPGMTDVIWAGVRDLSSVALPTVMRKIIAHALEGEKPLIQARSARKR
jgi:A/G-specific adenine glycosylase